MKYVIVFVFVLTAVFSVVGFGVFAEKNTFSENLSIFFGSDFLYSPINIMKLISNKDNILDKINDTLNADDAFYSNFVSKLKEFNERVKAWFEKFNTATGDVPTSM